MGIRRIRKSEWGKLRPFNAAEYGPAHILNNKIYYDWQFDNVFNNSKTDYPTLGFFIKGELAGTLGIVPAPAHYFSKTVSCSWLANLVVREDLRGLGYGYLLLEKSTAGVELAIDHTINEAAWPMFQKAGWRGENLKRFLYILNSKTPLYELPPSPPVPIYEIGWMFERISDFSEEITKFWQRIRGRYPITIDRTAEYLNWRYAHHPMVKYNLFVLSDESAIKALVVLRVEEVKREQPIGVKVGRIVDFVAEPEAEEFALAKTVEYGREQDLDFIDYFSSGDFHTAALERVGFVNGVSQSYTTLPILFNPVSTKRMHLNFAVKGGSGDLNNYYTTKGDGDQDRPY